MSGCSKDLVDKIKSEDECDSLKMCGEYGDETSSEPVLKPGEGKDVSDIAISRLLKDFNSAELLSQTPDNTPKGDATNPNQETKYEAVVSSLKCLHLRRPFLAKERKKITLKRKNLQNNLNLAVAASHYQKPIVWPAKLSSHCKKENSHLLNPPRLEIPQDYLNKGSNPKCEVTAGEKNPINATIFGSIASLDYSKFSFNSLSEQLPSGQESDIFKNKSGNVCSSSTSNESVSTSKRHSSGSLPPSKIPKINTTGDNLPLFSAYGEYRSLVSEESEHLLPLTCITSLRAEAANSSPSQPSSSLLVSEASQSASSTSASVHSPPNEVSINRSCSQEMRMEETNVNELASYFEDLLHIPRKMSIMAEMMYT
ncbi:protein hunchback [Biomphalaria glabrata]|nr:protein hunchback [Biomphalaria glabrata]